MGHFLVGTTKSFDGLERIKAPGLRDRKWVCIGLILTHLRSLNRGNFHAARTHQNFLPCLLVLAMLFLLLPANAVLAVAPEKDKVPLHELIAPLMPLSEQPPVTMDLASRSLLAESARQGRQAAAFIERKNFPWFTLFSLVMTLAAIALAKLYLSKNI